LENVKGKRPVGKPRRRCEDNIRTDLSDIGCKVLDWIYLVQVRDKWWTLVNTVMKFD
jgi:ribosome biogenesis protein Nip4